MRRPLGVTILALFSLGSSVPSLLCGVGLLANVVRRGLEPTHEPAMSAFILTLGAVGGVVLVTLGVVGVAVGVGLWKLRSWARAVALGLAMLGLGFFALITLASLFRPQPTRLLAQLAVVAGCGVIVWYLNRPAVRQAFVAERS